MSTTPEPVATATIVFLCALVNELRRTNAINHERLGSELERMLSQVGEGTPGRAAVRFVVDAMAHPERFQWKSPEALRASFRAISGEPDDVE